MGCVAFGAVASILILRQLPAAAHQLRPPASVISPQAAGSAGPMKSAARPAPESGISPKPEVPRVRIERWKAYYEGLARNDVRSALEKAQEELTGGELAAVLAGLLEELAKQEPELAIDWYLDHENDPLFAGGRHSAARFAMLEEAFRRLSARDPGKALESAARLTNDGVRHSVLMPIASAAVLEGKQEELLEMSKHLDDASRIFVSTAVIADWAEFDLAAAKIAYSRNLSAQEQADQASSLGVAWMQSAPREGADWWLATASDADDAITGIVNTWAGVSAAGTTHWVDSLQDPELRDTARNALANQLFESNPEEAIEMAAAIEAPDRRREVWQFMISLLAAREPTMADQLINAADPALKEMIPSPPSD